MSDLRLPASDAAGRTLTHYITMLMRESGLPIDSDVAAELRPLFRSAVEEAVNEAVRQALAAIPSETLE